MFMLAPGCSPWRLRSQLGVSRDVVTHGDGGGWHAEREQPPCVQRLIYGSTTRGGRRSGRSTHVSSPPLSDSQLSIFVTPPGQALNAVQKSKEKVFIRPCRSFPGPSVKCFLEERVLRCLLS